MSILTGRNLFGQEPHARRGEAAVAASTAVSGALPVGMITAYWGTTAPSGWLLCDGAAIPAQYSALIALVGANTPNLKGKVIVARDASQTEFDTLGETGGAKTVTLNVDQMPVHSHGQAPHGHNAINIHNEGGSGTAVANRYLIASGGASTLNWVVDQANPFIENNGGGNFHTNLQPYAVCSYIIRAAA